MIYPILPTGGYCCKRGFTDEEELMLNYMVEIADCMETALNKAYAQELFGYNSECSFNKVNNFYYLFDIMMWVYRDMQMNPTHDRDYFEELFSMDCWIKTFQCCGCNVTDAIDLFFNPYAFPVPAPSTFPPSLTASTTSSTTCRPPTITSSLATIQLHTATAMAYTITSNTSGATFQWYRDAVSCCSTAASSGTTAAITEVLTLQVGNKFCNVKYYVRACYNGCCSDWEELPVYLHEP